MLLCISDEKDGLERTFRSLITSKLSVVLFRIWKSVGITIHCSSDLFRICVFFRPSSSIVLTVAFSTFGWLDRSLSLGEIISYIYLEDRTTPQLKDIKFIDVARKSDRLEEQRPVSGSRSRANLALPNRPCGRPGPHLSASPSALESQVRASSSLWARRKLKQA